MIVLSGFLVSILYLALNTSLNSLSYFPRGKLYCICLRLDLIYGTAEVLAKSITYVINSLNEVITYVIDLAYVINYLNEVSFKDFPK